MKNLIIFFLILMLAKTIVAKEKDDANPTGGNSGTTHDFSKHDSKDSEHNKGSKDHKGSKGRTEIIEIKGLAFDRAVAGENERLVTEPDSHNAAVFEAYGEPGAVVTIQVREEEIFMTMSNGQKGGEIKVDSFKTGGSLNRQGKGYLDRKGRLQEFTLGATAHLSEKNLPGDYGGRGTLLIIYW